MSTNTSQTSPTRGTDNADSQNASRKRPRTSGIYQRKRATQACDACRARKTKCDNIRPVCGFCRRHDARCVYADSNTDYSAFDPASLAILERINHVVNLLETGQNPVPQAAIQSEMASPSLATVLHQTPSIVQEQVELDPDDELPPEAPDLPANTNNCEAVLKWPIFQGSVPHIKSFILGYGDVPLDTHSTPTSSLGRGIQEEDFTPLSTRFLVHVHVKNPILDVAEFCSYVKDASENGLRWDGPSCLVLIACALGSLSSPFRSNKTPEDMLATSPPAIVSKETTLVYYLAAKKRLGLIEPSLLRIQCLFLCGVLEMLLMNALRAWHYFNQACVQFQNLLWLKEHTESMGRDPISRETHRTEQRLYWSCFKSECELRCEIPLPLSGISRVCFPSILPSPPTELSSPPSNHHTANVAGLSEKDEERSWFYYLAEISFRRMMNRAYAAFGSGGEAAWLNNLPRHLRRYHAFNEQIDTWSAHIPPQINFDHDGGFNNELAQHVRVRAMACQEWIHRPFLYYAIHQPSDDPGLPQAVPLAEKCLDLCVQIQFIVEPFHRHHGTWFVARTSITRALLLLAGARSERLRMPERWKDAVRHAVQAVEYWAQEAPDLGRSLGVLRDLMGAI